jgi:predicted nuclease of restriction endonuclease-like RecB superfamily
VLTTDLVRTRRRAGRLEAILLTPAERRRLAPVADLFVDLARAHVGRTRAELLSALDDVPQRATDYKRIRGLRKLLLDRCTFESPEVLDPGELRRSVFLLAARARQELADGVPFDRGAVLAAAAAESGLTAEQVDSALFADLKENQRLVRFDALSGDALLDAYDTAQNQAILLRATRVVVTLRCSDPGAYRTLFHKLKFRRLLFAIERQAEGSYRVEIDGPHSLFRSLTKYGLQLALILPALAQADEWSLDADIRWGRDREALRFQLDGRGDGAADAVRMPDDVEHLRASFAALETPWRVDVAGDILDLPGFGVCVPDLAFIHPDGRRVYLEVLGFWSRAAVWRRVELVEAGLPEPILFAVSERLRVSEEVLDAELPGQLYVYKGVMSAAAIAQRLEKTPLPGPEA